MVCDVKALVLILFGHAQNASKLHAEEEDAACHQAPDCPTDTRQQLIAELLA
eukprot:CAMPEP_0172759356 /NCGR_PEP_ID=MMETSP1074-20121228/167598_1 /TAXON_ID=2916 /ORGANISM="Ceratium fusus, Strain PA161109" /LENGTH=51 /DNA_ID=CAMNT_0013593123 /DNA_START=95 /DNA_END=246 /DNA_ORIENTATION=-